MENKNQTMKKISFTFVRHGQSEGNSSGLLQGQSNTALSAEGREQSRLAGLALSHIKFDQIYSSNLDRAFDTASIIIQENKESSDVLPDENSNIVKVNELLRERCFGVFELQPHKEFRAAANKAGFVGKELYHFIPDGGESLDAVKKRGIDFLNFIFESYEATDYSSATRNILVVSHSGFLRQMGIYLLKDCKASYSEDFKLPNGYKFDENYLDKAWKNTAMSTFEVKMDENRKIVSVKCTQFTTETT